MLSDLKTYHSATLMNSVGERIIYRKQGNSRKTCTSVSLTTLKSLTVWITTNCGKILRRWNTTPPYLQCTGFSLQWLLLWSTGSRKCGLQQLQHKDSVAAAPEPRLNSCGVLAGEFFTTEPPGKPLIGLLLL